MQDPLTITYSSSTTFQWCPRRYYWRYERGWSQAQVSDALAIGSLVHKGLETIHTDGYGAFDAAQEAIYTEAQQEGWTEEHALTASFLTEQYTLRYSDEKFGWESIAVEPVFHVDIGDGLDFAGKIDWIVQNSDGDFWVVECKTAYKIDNDYLRKLPLDRQITLYMMAAGHMGIKPIKGIVYDVIGKPNKYRRQGESLPVYLGRVSIEYASAPGTYFARQSCFRTDEDFDAAMQSLRNTARLIRECRDDDYWDQHTGTCFLRNRECPYVKLCVEGETERVVTGFKYRKPHCELGGE